jgi:hypothetical protein
MMNEDAFNHPLKAFVRVPLSGAREVVLAAPTAELAAAICAVDPLSNPPPDACAYFGRLERQCALALETAVARVAIATTANAADFASSPAGISAGALTYADARRLLMSVLAAAQGIDPKEAADASEALRASKGSNQLDAYTLCSLQSQAA